MNVLKTAAAAAFTLSLVAAPVQGQNLLNNAGFESDLGFDFADTSNWNGFFGGPEGVFLEAFNNTGAPAFDGAQSLELTIEAGTAGNGGFGSFTGHTQTVGGIVAGEAYDLSVYSRNNDSGLTGTVEFRVEWFNAEAVEISRDQIDLQDVLTDTYQLVEIDAVVAPAAAVSANIVFAVATFVDGTDGVAADHSVLFDNASFALVPEPASLALLGLGGLALAGRRRRNA